MEQLPNDQIVGAIYMLQESNAIEGVTDAEALVQAIYAWDFLLQKDTLTKSDILRAHKILMVGQPLQPDQRGYYRKINVTVGGRRGASPVAIDNLMADWIAKANKMESPLAEHVEFERIHPFADGNGRIGRMLMNWQNVKAGKPIAVFTAEDRQDYYQLFKDL